MATGNTKIQLPIAKAVGSQHQATSANPGAPAQPQVTVPGPTPLYLNGHAVIIDVRSMSGADVVNAINQVQGVMASIDGQNRLVITGADIMGDSNLRAILGV